MLDTLSVPSSKIGTQLTNQVNEFIKMCEDLRENIGDDYTDLLSEVETPLRAASGAISVIGQVKSGKTSLLNSFMGKPNFLPSDVNPWTAVVTNLHFAKPSGPEAGADFSFFDDAQWQKFSSREGRLAEIANSIPGGEEKLAEIEEEVAQMRQRAQKRLGEQFHVLLGKRHKFKQASTDVLARYICAGDEPEAVVKNPVVGRFADITREANVYFPAERYGFPIKLIDTPGLNDPLLIREEITLQCLEKSDIFILVLSAHQAFSSSDLYLLRILNALRLDRLIVFINRVDELNNPEGDVPDIRRHVVGMLKNENPNAEIPVIFGSADWAESALTGEGEVDGEKINYFSSGKEQYIQDIQENFSDYDRAKVWAASGLPDLDREITKLLDGNLGQNWLKSAKIDLGNAVQIIKSDAREQVALLKRQRAIMNDEEPPELEEDIAQRQANLDSMEQEITSLLASTKVALEQTGSTSFLEVQRGLRALIEEFITTEVEQFTEVFRIAKAKGKAESWTCDPAPLRSSLNRYFRSEFPKVNKTVLAKLETEMAKLTERMVELGLPDAANIKVNTAKFEDATPNTTALSKVVSFDLGTNWWKGWFGRFKSEAEITEKFAKMIRKQFVKIEADLLENASDKLAETSTSALESFMGMQKTLLDRRKTQTTNTIRNISGSFEEIQERIVSMETRSELCEKVGVMIEAA